MGEWQIIDTAPRDGTDILLSGPEFDSWWKRPPVVGASKPDEWGDDRWYGHDDVGEALNIQPTHWLPLPPVPSDPTSPGAQEDRSDA